MSTADNQVASSRKDFLQARMKEYGIPNYMQDSLTQYILTGRSVGEFLSAILNNDLAKAVSHGDDMNQPIIHMYVKFLYNHAPSGCWGRSNSTKSWMECGGLFPRRQPMVTD